LSVLVDANGLRKLLGLEGARQGRRSLSLDRCLVAPEFEEPERNADNDRDAAKDLREVRQ